MKNIEGTGRTNREVKGPSSTQARKYERKQHDLEHLEDLSKWFNRENKCHFDKNEVVSLTFPSLERIHERSRQMKHIDHNSII